MARKTKYRSRIARTVHETVQGLYRIGLVDEKTMRRFDASCLRMDEKLTSKKRTARRARQS
jgi:putative transcriptional regulator